MSTSGSGSIQSQPLSISRVVFDDYVSTASTAASATVVALTNSALDDVLGFYDQIALQVVVDDASVGTAPAGLTVQIAHSADGLNFVYKNGTPEINTPTQLNIGTPTYMSFGYDRGAYPSLGFVRLVVTLIGMLGPVRAHVRITVMGNNQNEQAFTKMVWKAMDTQAGISKNYVLVYGPGQKVARSMISELIQFVGDLPTASAFQIAQQQLVATDVIAHPSAHSQSEFVNAQAFLLWEPILLMKTAGGFRGDAVTVPAGFLIAFLGNGHYALVKGNVALWESKQASAALFPQNVDSVGVGVKGNNVLDLPGKGHASGSTSSSGPGLKPSHQGDE